MKRKFEKYLNERGFTLVELMVVVAIIGILAAIGVPSYRKYQVKAKTAEAGLSLASLYTGELTLWANYGTYAACVKQLGMTQPVKSYYVTGFAVGQHVGKSYPAALTDICPPGVSQTVAATNANLISATDHLILPLTLVTTGPQMVDAATDFTNSYLNGDAVSTSNQFTAIAAGSLSIQVTIKDIQSIDETKKIKVIQYGY